MKITGAAKVAGVVGWPVAHSLSPLIHNAWIEALGLDAAYVPFAVPPERFERFVEGLRGGAVVGLNVTLPHKPAAYAVTDLRSDAAAAAGVSNLLLFVPDGILSADNTDGQGLLQALSNNGLEWSPKKGPVMVLGSGGAAQAAVQAFVAASAPEIRMVARRTEALGAREGWLGRAFAYGFDDLDRALDGVTVVINATSAGLNGIGELPPMDAAPPGAVFMDMVYSPLRTTFLKRAAARGHPTVDGLAMLIGQARPSFEAFFGVAPPPPEVVDVRALCLAALGEPA